MELSLIIPIYNEEIILKDNLEQIYQYLNSSKNIIDKYEIILINNGSTDNSTFKIKKILHKYDHVFFVNLPQKGLGLALKYGLETSRLQNVMFFPIDIPFGFKIIPDSLSKINSGYDLVLGSKSHPKSLIRVNKTRQKFSKFYNYLIRKLFNISILDTQGTFLVKKSIINKILPYLNSKGPLFQTQLVIFSSYVNALIVEIPVKYVSQQRQTRMRVKDGLSIIFQLLEYFIKFPKIRKKIMSN